MLGLSVSFWLAFAGFLVVLAIAVALEREVRLLARERLGTLPVSAWLGGARTRDRDRSSPSDAGRRASSPSSAASSCAHCHTVK